MANTIDEIDPPLSKKLEHSSRFLLAARLLLEIFLVVSSSKDVINEYDEADVILAEDDEPTSVEMHRRVALSRKGKVDHGGDAKAIVCDIFICVAGNGGRLP